MRKEALAQAIVANDFDIAGFQEVDRTIRQQLPALVSAGAIALLARKKT